LYLVFRALAKPRWEVIEDYRFFVRDLGMIAKDISIPKKLVLEQPNIQVLDRKTQG
jgi:hypothetical protein